MAPKAPTKEQGTDEEKETLLDAKDTPEEHKVKLKKIFKAQKNPIIFTILFEFLICLTFTQWGRVGNNAGEAGAYVKHFRLAYWATFGGFLLLRAIILAIWRMGKGPQSIWCALYMFCSSFQYVIYIALYYAMTETLSSVSLTETTQTGFSEDPAVPGVFGQSCTTPYAPGDCDGRAVIGGVDCCVIVTGAVKTATAVVPFTSVSIKTAFGLGKWMAILAMSWVWMDVPLIKFSADDKDFMQAIWLDILDAVVFGDYILRAEVQFPDHGLVGVGSAQGRMCTSALGRDCEGSLHNLLWFVWLLALSSSIICPTVYTALKFLNHQKEKGRSLDDAIVDLTHNIRLLSEKKAATNLDEALQLQLATYHDADSDEEEQRVVEHGSNKPGMATMKDGSGMYHVKFDDKTEADVPVDTLDPDFDHHKDCFGHKCCHGWFKAKYLSPQKKHKLDAWERRAKWFNAVRTIFCLELWFLCFRFYFDVYLGHGVSILFLKNIVWFIINFMLIFSCGNESATICNGTPIRNITQTIKGTKLSKIMVGPAAMFRVATEMYESKLKQGIECKKHDLEAMKAWLCVEKEKVGDMQPHDTAKYKAAIEDVENNISLLDKKEKEIHI